MRDARVRARRRSSSPGRELDVGARARTSACRCCWRWPTAYRASTRAARSTLAQEADALAAEPRRHARARRGAVPAGTLRGPAARPRRRRSTLYAEALRRSRSRGDERAIAKTLRAISFVHDTLGDFSRALDYQFRALEIDERTGNTAAARRRCARSASCIRVRRSGDRPRLLPAEPRAVHAAEAMRSSAARRSTTSASTSRTWASSTRRTRRCNEAHCRCSIDAGAAAAAVGDAQQPGPRPASDWATSPAPSARCARRSTLSEATGYRYGVAHAQPGARHAVHGAGAQRRGARVAAAALDDLRAAQNMKPTRYECHEALAALLREHRRPRHGAATTSGAFTRSSAKCSRRRRATSCARSQIQFEVAAAKREAELAARAAGGADARQCRARCAQHLADRGQPAEDDAARPARAADLRGRADGPRQPPPARPAPGRRIRAGVAPRPAARRGHRRPRPLQVGERPLFARGRRRRAARDSRSCWRRRCATPTWSRASAARSSCWCWCKPTPRPRCACAKSCAAAVADHAWDAIHPGLALTLSIGVCADTTLPGARADARDGRPQPVYRRRRRGRNRVGRADAVALELADEPDHHAEDLERALGADDRIGLVLGLEHEASLLRGRAASA